MDWQALQARTNTAVIAVFGESITLNGVVLQADFVDAYADGNVGTFGMATSQPAVIVASPLVPSDVVGKPCVARSIAYRVASEEADGRGMTRLLLEVA